MDFQDRGRYPHIVPSVYGRVKADRFQKGTEKELPLRARFTADRKALSVEQPILDKALNTITEGLELYRDGLIDFNGGAAFAYELFQHA